MTKCGAGRKLRDHHTPSPPPCSPCSPRPGRALSCATPLHTSAKPHHRSICAETHATSWNRSRDFPLFTPGRAPPAPKRFPQVSVSFEGRARGQLGSQGTAAASLVEVRREVRAIHFPLATQHSPRGCEQGMGEADQSSSFFTVTAQPRSPHWGN